MKSGSLCINNSVVRGIAVPNYSSSKSFTRRTSMNIYVQQIVTASINSKYTNWYLSLVSMAKGRAENRIEAKRQLGYVEAHHIWPKSLCDTRLQINDKENLVYLTAKEHFISHWLLSKMMASESHKQKMLCAFVSMRFKNQYHRRMLNGNEYAALRLANANKKIDTDVIAIANEKKRGTKTYHDPITREMKFLKDHDIIPIGWIPGRPKWTEEQKANRRGSGNPAFGKPSWNKGIPMSEGHKKIFCSSRPAWNKGKKMSNDFCETMRNVSKGTVWAYDPMTDEFSRFSSVEMIPTGWIRGKPKSKCHPAWNKGIRRKL